MTLILPPKYKNWKIKICDHVDKLYEFDEEAATIKHPSIPSLMGIELYDPFEDIIPPPGGNHEK